jgi:hypothetical protein
MSRSSSSRICFASPGRTLGSQPFSTICASFALAKVSKRFSWTSPQPLHIVSTINTKPMLTVLIGGVLSHPDCSDNLHRLFPCSLLRGRPDYLPDRVLRPLHHMVAQPTYSAEADGVQSSSASLRSFRNFSTRSPTRARARPRWPWHVSSCGSAARRDRFYAPVPATVGPTTLSASLLPKSPCSHFWNESR